MQFERVQTIVDIPGQPDPWTLVCVGQQTTTNSSGQLEMCGWMGKLARWNHIHEQMNMSVYNDKPTHAVTTPMIIDSTQTAICC